MNFVIRSTVAAVLLGCLLSIPATAAGPVSGEVGAMWWQNDFESTGATGVDSDAGAPGFRAELWMFKRYGLRAGRYSSDLDDIGADASDYTSFDFMWRAYSATENSYLAIGLGWQEMALESIGLVGDTSGARVNVEGRLGLGGVVYLYAQGSYLPDLDDASSNSLGGGTFSDLSGLEYDAGVSWKFAPFVVLRAGYRAQSVDFTYSPVVGPSGGGEAESRGFHLGLGVRF